MVWPWQNHAYYFDEANFFGAANLPLCFESLISENFCNFQSATMLWCECMTNKLFGCKRISTTFPTHSQTSNSIILMRIGNLFIRFHCLVSFHFYFLLCSVLGVLRYMNIICIKLSNNKPLEVKSSIHVFVFVVNFLFHCRFLFFEHFREQCNYRFCGFMLKSVLHRMILSA